MENPLIPGVKLSEIAEPLLFLVAREDNSITEFGNKLIRDNYAAATNRAWKLEVADAGHWSVSDLDGLIPAFNKGCGPGTRQDDGSAFEYLASCDDPRFALSEARHWRTRICNAIWLASDAWRRCS